MKIITAKEREARPRFSVNTDKATMEILMEMARDQLRSVSFVADALIKQAIKEKHRQKSKNRPVSNIPADQREGDTGGSVVLPNPERETKTGRFKKATETRKV